MKNITYHLSKVDLWSFPKLFMGKSGVYLWTNLNNGKCYIGSSINLGRRVAEYLNPARLVRELSRGESIIYRAMIKYGYLSFSFEILEYVNIDPLLSNSEKDDILEKTEQKYIDLLQPDYNILKLAGSNQGHKMSEEARAKISAAKKGKPSHLKGIIISEESRLLIKSNSAMNKKVYVYSPEGVLINSFSSITDCAICLGISRHRIERALDTPKQVDGKYIFKSM